jgi:hypothetical protein
VPFAQAAALLTDLAGITLSTKRVERAAEADGTTAAVAISEHAEAILTRRVIPLPPRRRSRTCSTSPWTAPVSR